MTVAELAGSLGLPFEGDGRAVLTGAAPLEHAAPGALTFAAGKFVDAARQSQAACLLVPPDYPATGQTVIRHASPRALFARALAFLYPPEALLPGIHPTAVLGEGVRLAATAEIGAGVVIGSGTQVGERVRIAPGCVLGREVRIGDDTRLHARVTLYGGVTLGKRVIVHSGAVIGADGFGFAPEGGRWVKFPQVGSVEIEDDVEIGANCCVDRAALGVTSIGQGSKLDNLVHVAHNCRIGRHVVIAAQTGFSGGVTIGDYAVIGGQVGVGDKARIESRAVVGSGAGILTSKIVRAGEPVWGTPARPLRQYLKQLAFLHRQARREQ